MVLKPAIRNEHHEAYRAGRLNEIPAEILPLLEENYGKLQNAEGPKKGQKSKEVKEVKSEGEAA